MNKENLIVQWDLWGNSSLNSINNDLFANLSQEDTNKSKELYEIIKNFSSNWELLGKYLSNLTCEQLETFLINPYKPLIIEMIKSELNKRIDLVNPNKINQLDITISHIDYFFIFELSSIRSLWKPKITSKNILSWMFTIPNVSDPNSYMAFPFEFNLNDNSISIFDGNTNMSIIKRFLRNKLK